MPAATSSRRMRRQDTDDIEDANATQARDEELDDDVEAPSQPRRTKDAKKEGKARQEVEEDDAREDSDDGSDLDDPLADFTDQPVDKQQAMRIMGLSHDWGQIRQGIHVSSYDLVRDIASSLAEFQEGEKAEKVSSYMLL